MQVTFKRTGERRYGVFIDGPGLVPLKMDPAVGYDPKMPHDMAHFIIENEFGIEGGLFGQLAAGGFAGTFHPVDGGKKAGRTEKTSKRISAASTADADLSERLVRMVFAHWIGNKLSDSDFVKGFSNDQIARVAAKFEELSASWEKLEVGGSLSLEWRGRKANRKR